jgi:hypothetical protein
MKSKLSGTAAGEAVEGCGDSVAKSEVDADDRCDFNRLAID